MNFAWIDSGGTGDGAVTGLNRAGYEGEETGTCTRQQLIRGMDHDFYEVVDGYFTPKDQSEVDAIIAQREADAATEATRLDEIEAEQGASGLKQYTMAQVDTYLDNRFAAMTDLDSVKTELRAILDKMVPYLMG